MKTPEEMIASFRGEWPWLWRWSPVTLHRDFPTQEEICELVVVPEPREPVCEAAVLARVCKIHR